MTQQAFGIRFGKPDKGSVVAVGCSIASNTDISITINNQVVSLVTSQIGVDHTPDQAGFVGNKEITGLSQYTKYPYTATHNGVSYSAYTWTAPGLNDDFIIIPITCDNFSSLGGLPAGGYTQARAIAEANPNKGVYFVHIDDHGYFPLNALNDNAGTFMSAGAGTAARDGALVYDYALAALSMYGIFSESGNDYCTWGQDEDRIWCMRHIPVLPSMGDWDAGDNDMGWDIDQDGAGATKFANSQVVWNAFLAPFQGTQMTVGTQNWSHVLGCVKIVAPDGVTLSSGNGNATVMPSPDIYSSAQITDIINACDDLTVPFKMLVPHLGIRYLIDDNTEFNSGSQHAIGGNPGFSAGAPTAAHAEYAQLMTDAGGLMSKSSCNGRSGVLMTVHGDYHAAKVVENKSAAGVFDEWFYSISVGTINGSINFNTSGISVGVTIDGSTPEMIKGTYSSNDWWVVPMYVYGSRDIKEVEVTYLDKNSAVLWNKKFTERSMNDAIDVGFNVSANGTGCDGGGL